MALPSSAYSICSQAVLALGGMPITDNDNVEKRFLDYNYSDIKNYLLATHDWHFATRKIFPNYQHSSRRGHYFDLAADVLRPLKFAKRVQFRINGRQVHLSEPGGEFSYIWHVREDSMPPFFRRILVDFLIANLAPLMTGSITRTDFFTRKAEHSLRVGQQIDQTFSSAKNVNITDFPFISVRR